ncbi:sensor histidine kinase [Streptomyces spectabilis]|uniref:sensor histidine kinase n=1 Tax=Streptomyces spectabilis TaxID=68270 RepID=UPI001CEFAE2C|nr:histidine kinase [Streptomyces spectabilis]
MKRSWVELVFDEKYATPRVLAVGAALLGALLLVQRPSQAQDWGFAAAALALCVAGVRWAFGMALAQAGLLVAAHASGAGVVPTLKVLAAVALFEVAVRCPGRRPAVAAAVLSCAVVANRVTDLPGELAPVFYKAGVVAGVPLLLGAYVRATRDAARRAREHLAREEAGAERRVRAARAAERASIARELHDLVAHHVSSMVVRVGVARHVLPDAGEGGPGDPRIGAVLDDLHASGTAAMADLRHLVAVLRDPDSVGPDAPPLLTPGALATAVASVVTQSARSGLTINATVDEQGLARVDTARGLAVLRLAQEGLANVARHAGVGAHARLTVLVAEGGGVQVTVEDDGGTGQGPDTPAAGPHGHGLVGLRERVHLLDGRLHAGPTARGWRLSAALPAPLNSGKIPQRETKP